MKKKKLPKSMYIKEGSKRKKKKRKKKRKYRRKKGFFFFFCFYVFQDVFVYLRKLATTSLQDFSFLLAYISGKTGEFFIFIIFNYFILLQ